jgi:hypothetical protein
MKNANRKKLRSVRKHLKNGIRVRLMMNTKRSTLVKKLTRDTKLLNSKRG